MGLNDNASNDAPGANNKHEQILFTGVIEVNQQKCYASVTMHLSEKFSVPDDIALLYDFVNSLDLRRYVEGGQVHVPDDELDSAAKLQAWLRNRGAIAKKATLSAQDLGRALALRDALRSFLQLAPAERAADAAIAAQINAAAAHFPMTLAMGKAGAITLQSGSLTGGLSRVLAEFYQLSVTDRLDRMKMCASDECSWIFYDRSKPGNRRWCSSTLCGNREKIRVYRNRQKQGYTGD
ncbi:hypothetical protein GCM10027565_15660 [Bordetella tumulicola]